MDSDELHRNETRERVFHGAAWFSGSQPESERFRQWESESRIFGIEHNGLKFYAAYQFDEKRDPLPIIKDILQHLRYEDPWAIAAWFQFPNSWISQNQTPESPKDALSRRDDVLLAAKRSSCSYVA